MYATSIEQLELLMQQTIQSKGINVLEHGYMVSRAFETLIDDLESGQHVESGLYRLIKDQIIDPLTLIRYHVYHDCGKPFCKQDEGRFPDHALHSYNQWNYLYPEDKTVSELMKLDMAFHTLKGEEVKEFWSNPLAPTLYFTAWSELEANASMFGGRESDSYKIKRKRLIQAGKKY